jgi:GNAT superfamily N-acetyltransferase
MCAESRLRPGASRGDSAAVDIRIIDPAHAADASAWFEVYAAAAKHDLPCGPWWLERELSVAHESNDYRQHMMWLAEESGVAVGASLARFPLKDNLRLAEVEVFVRPEVRRRGLGAVLFAELERSATDHGRPSLLAAVSGPLKTVTVPGSAFAERFGFTRRNMEIRRVQRAPFQLGRLAELEQEALPRAVGYRLESWRDRIPQQFLIEYARLAGRMSTDAPLGDLDYEPEQWDPDRVLVSEERRIRMGRDWWCTVAVAPDGSLAGMTEIVVPGDRDQDGYQGDTIVDPDHRGHRLGLLLKVANLRALLTDRPGMSAIWTWNAESNRFMISVNEKLGYVKAGWEAMYQRD